VRYADDFILGFTGTKEEATQIMTEINDFLHDRLKLKVNETKSKIHHSSDKGIKYLGFYIRYLEPKRTIDKSKEALGIKQVKMQAINSAQLRIPVELLLIRLAEKGYATRRKNGTFRATSVRKLSSFEDKLIVNLFSSVIRGIINYYKPANKFSDLWPVVAMLRKSCALTLADKHKLKTASQAYKKFGPNLKIKNSANPKDTVTLFYPDSLTTSNNFALGKANVNTSLLERDRIEGSYKTNPKTSSSCQFPGCSETNNLEEHHINELRSLKKKGLHPYLISLIGKKRKTVTLCQEHHNQLHSGKAKQRWQFEESAKTSKKKIKALN
jgi:hypothetical protein